MDSECPSEAALHFPQLSLPIILPKWAASPFVQNDELNSLTQVQNTALTPAWLVGLILCPHPNQTKYLKHTSLLTPSFLMFVLCSHCIASRPFLLLSIHAYQNPSHVADPVQSLINYQCASEFRLHKARPRSSLYHNFLSLLVYPKLFHFSGLAHTHSMQTCSSTSLYNLYLGFT